MKKIIFILSVLILAVSSCTDRFEEYNTDTKHPEAVPGESLFANAQKELADFVNNTNVNINIFKLMSQYWTETTYTDEANYDLITRNIPDNIYSRLYLRVLKDLKESKELITADEISAQDPDLENKTAIKTNKLAVIKLVNAYVYSQLVDVFGSVPYTEALDINNVYPKYDKGEDIYNALFVEIDAALAALDADYDSFGSSDLYYGGDVEAWIKFAHSLKIRLAINIADYNSAKAKSVIESSYSKCFSSNSDDCMIAYVTSAPNFNQLYADLVASGRHDFVPANTIVDIMNDLSDPRLSAYFTQTDTSTVTGVVKLAYLGGEYGYTSPYGQCSHIASRIQKPDFPGIMLTYSEVCFYLSEAAARGYSVGGTAEAWYNKGITASFDFWDVDDVTSYLAKPEVAYATASGTWKQKIALQAWLASYTRGLEGYNTWRRLDYPVFNLPEYISEYSEIPVRFTFPVNEQTLNAANYNAAATAIGGDEISTKIFWDLY